ncbi:hypothetical protein GG344DRAFT_84697 [Lentinula edodes]|nr:hypothetical protein GG344DRAFT_84697 [Lentinula edodes]
MSNKPKILKALPSSLQCSPASTLALAALSAGDAGKCWEMLCKAGQHRPGFADELRELKLPAGREIAVRLSAAQYLQIEEADVYYPLSRFSAVPLSRCPAVPMSRFPAVPLSRCPAVPMSRFPAFPLIPLIPLIPLDRIPYPTIRYP